MLLRLLVSLLAVFHATEACAATSTTTTPAPTANTPCKNCAPETMTTTPLGGAGEKNMDSDVIDRTGDCATRVITCRGGQATIEFNRGAAGTEFDADGDMIAMATLVCNADGTGWLHPPDLMIITTTTCAIL